MTHHIKIFAAAALLFLSPQHSKGFALLGPYADWMQPSNGFRVGDIGGSMDLGEEYRWNVPLLTYGYDQSFLDYFGSNGVTAVEQAFQILNNLPPASSLSLAGYSGNIPRINSSAQVQQFLDIKTATLGVLLEQLGLAQPTRSVFVLRQWNPIFESLPSEFQWPTGVIPTNILERNFDPESLVPSHSVNNSLFTGEALRYSNIDYADVFETLVDPTDLFSTAIADLELDYGKFFTGLSADDAGGLRYLLHTNNVNYESLLPDVHGATNNPNFVNAAMRPGVNKITFVRQQFDSQLQQWIPVTNQFTDTFLTNNTAMQQSLERVVASPDFIFCAGDRGGEFSSLISRTPTTNWLNGGVGGALGPGVIRPAVKFIFNKLHRAIYTDDALPDGSFELKNPRWSAFSSFRFNFHYDESLATQFTVRLYLRTATTPPGVRTFEWHPAIPFQGNAIFQTSTNLNTWTTVTTLTNFGGVIEWNHRRFQSQSQRFFRVIPE